MADVERVVLGSGAYGCAVWPAMLFSSSIEVKESNMTEYVTKLASDATDEYDLAKGIESRLLATGSPLAKITGVFPVDPLACGISIKDLKLNAKDTTIISSCKSQAGTILAENLKNALLERGPIRLREYVGPRPRYRELSVSGSRRPRSRSRSRGVLSRSGSRSRSRSRGPLSRSRRSSIHLSAGAVLCGIQYPRYLGNVRGTIFVPPGSPVNYQYDIYFQTAEKLRLLHSVGVYHLDIKGPNMCYFGPTDVRFADWGLSFATGGSLEALSMAYERLSAGFLAYYGDLCYYSGRLDAFLQQECAGIFDRVKEILYERTMCLLSLHINLETDDIVDVLVKEGLDVTVAEHITKRLSNKIEIYMHEIGKDLSELIYEYSKTHDLDETLDYVDNNYTFNESLEQFVYFVFAYKIFDRDAWFQKVEAVYPRIMRAFKTVDNCTLGAAFVRITDSYARSKIEADALRRIR